MPWPLKNLECCLATDTASLLHRESQVHQDKGPMLSTENILCAFQGRFSPIPKPSSVLIKKKKKTYFFKSE